VYFIPKKSCIKERRCSEITLLKHRQKRILVPVVSGHTEPGALCLPLARLGRWQGQITTEIFPTISDSERVKMRHDRFSGIKSKRAFHPLFASIIGVFMKF